MNNDDERDHADEAYNRYTIEHLDDDPTPEQREANAEDSAWIQIWREQWPEYFMNS